jgi:hypothetical protein
VSPVAAKQNVKKPVERKQPRQAEGSQHGPADSSRPMSVEAILQLQAFAGNAAVAELLERQSRPPMESASPTAPSPLAGEAPGGPPHEVSSPGSGQGPGGPSLIENAAAVAVPVASAIGGPGIAAFGSLLGSLVTPKAGQPEGKEATEAAAAPGEQTAASGEKGASTSATGPQAAEAPGAAAGATPSAAQSGAGPAEAKGAKTSAGAGDKPVDQGPAGAAGAADGAKGAETSAAAGAAPEAGAATAAPPSPETDPNFQAVKGRVHQSAQQTKSHAPAGAKVAEAQAAAHGPANEVASQAGAAQVEKMGAQSAGGFDKNAFMDAVRKAIDAAAPKTLEEADDFKGSGKAGQVKGQVSGLVGQNKDAAEGAIKGATEAPPDTSAAQPKPVTPMPAEQPGAPPAAVGAASAMPSPAAPEEVSLAKGPAEVNASMKDADVTEQQLKESNEPEFTGALAAKQTAEKHSAEAPQAFRQEEHGILEKAKGSASSVSDHGQQSMHGARANALTAVGAGKGDAKAKDEAARAEVSGKIESIYATTKTEVTGILDGIDPQVDKAFQAGEEGARASFESYVDVRMTAYKDDRYSGLRGKWRWVKDKFAGLPSEVNQFYVSGRELYISRMEGVISAVADIVGRELTRAKDRIAQGKSEITKYVATLGPDLKKVGLEAQQSIQGKFDELNQAVDAKQEDMVNHLAQKYVESRDAVDAHIKEMKEANKGLIDKAKDAVMGVINTIRHLKDMLLNVLSKAAGVIGTIISAPIKFLGNLVDGIGQGLKQFMSNIGEHLKKGLLSWLFGALGDAGLVMPEHFDLKGILSIIMQVLGLTYSHIRGLAVGIVGEEVVAHLEKSLSFFQVLIKEGPAGLWKWIVEKISELKETVMTQIKAFIQEKVIIAGIMWLIGLLNPVAAFIKACKAIYDIVKFFVERAEQVGELVSSIIDSIGAIAGGALGEAAGKVETALAKGIPVAIGFLASLLGLGGISDKIKSVIQAIQEPIHNIIGKVLGVVLKPFKWIGNKIKQGAGWAKKKLEQGVAFVKDKAKAGVAFVKGKAAGIFGKKKGPDQRSPAEKDAALAAARDESQHVVNDGSRSPVQIKKALSSIRSKYNMQYLELVTDQREAEKETVHVEGRINPDFKLPPKVLFGDPKKAVLKANLYFNTRGRLIEPQDRLITVSSMEEARALMKRLGVAVAAGEEGYLTTKSHLAGVPLHFSSTTPMGVSKGKRAGYEGALPTPGSVPMPTGPQSGLVDKYGQPWERAHVGGGPGTGFEAPWILYAPNEVNQVLQNNGIEQFLRDLFVQQAKRKDLRGLEVYQTAEAFAQTGPAPHNYASMRLERMHYEIFAQLHEGGPRQLVLAADIYVEGTTANPKVYTEGDEMIAPNFEAWLERVYLRAAG